MIANIVFDLDGTLIDSAPDIHGIANAVLADRGGAPIDLPMARSFVGRGAPNFIRQLRAARAIPEAQQDAMLEMFVTLYDDAVSLTHPYPRVMDVLAQLSQEHRLGLCTNKPHRPCLSVLRHLGMEGFFTEVLGGDSLPVKKPDPAPLLATYAAMGPGPRVFVGDSEVDAETAERAGVPFILFTLGYRKTPVAELPHAAAFDDFAALPGIIDAVLAQAAPAS